MQQVISTTGTLRTMRVLWAALLGSVLIHPVILVATRHAEPGPHVPEDVIAIALALTALCTAVASVVMPGTLMRNAIAQRLAANPLPTEEQQSYTDRGDHGFREAAAVKTERVFSNPVEAEQMAFRMGMTPFILGIALAEAVAHFGLVLGFMGAGLLHAAPYFVVCLALQAPRYPTREGILRAFEEAAGGRFSQDYLGGAR